MSVMNQAMPPRQRIESKQPRIQSRVVKKEVATQVDKRAAKSNKPCDNLFGRLINKNLVIRFDPKADYERIRHARFGLGLNQSAFASLTNSHNQSVISRLECEDFKPDDRTFSLMLLVSGYHPAYKLREKADAGGATLYVFPPSSSNIKATRRSIACGKLRRLTQAQMASLLGLSDKHSVNAYERGKRAPSVACWTLFLLATSQHPNYEVIRRPQSKQAANAAKTTKKPQVLGSRQQEADTIVKLVSHTGDIGTDKNIQLPQQFFDDAPMLIAGKRDHNANTGATGA